MLVLGQDKQGMKVDIVRERERHVLSNKVVGVLPVKKGSVCNLNIGQRIT
jgi:hypothetical protein